VTAEPPDAPRPPALRVVRGDATPEEIAALVAVVMAASGGEDEPVAPPARSAWADRSRQMRTPLFPGRGAWRRSALPG
jgi:hypothetical protein